jgi:glucan 1,3-beta-glucosidase
VNEVKSCPSLSPSNPSQWWYEAVTHNGESSYMDSSYKGDYVVFRNVVTDFGADNSGAADASAAIQNAINGTIFHYFESLFTR